MSKGWYPIIDYNKCAGCMACNDMCRYGVYKLDTEQRKRSIRRGVFENDPTDRKKDYSA